MALLDYTEADLAVADAALEYAHTILSERDDLNDYETNLRIVASQTSINARLAGLAASLIPYFKREMEKKAQAEARALAGAESKHIGEIGKRMDLCLTMTGVFETEGYYGITYISKFVTDSGSICTWFASSDPRRDMEMGKPYHVAATVKKHDVYKGVNQTVLSRCVVYTEEGWAQTQAKAAKKAARAQKKEAKEAQKQIEPLHGHETTGLPTGSPQM